MSPEERAREHIDEQLQAAMTSRQLKVRQKGLNIAGLQLADLLARPSRDEILMEQGCLQREVSEFGRRLTAIMQAKYDRSEGRIHGKKLV